MTSTPTLHAKRYASVALLRHIKNPILLAKEMLLRGNRDLAGLPSSSPADPDPSGPSGGAQGHCFLSGPTAEALGKAWGLETVPEKYFWTRRRWEEHRRGLSSSPLLHHQQQQDQDERDDPAFWPKDSGSWDGKVYLPQGTVGCVVLDQYGTLCVATSTGGLTNKLPGRIGDTPSAGAGFWAEEWIEHLPPPAAGFSEIPRSPWQKALPEGLLDVLGDCLPPLPPFLGYHALLPSPPTNDTKDEEHHHHHRKRTRAIALSGTGNGDSFLRLAAARSTAAIACYRYSSPPPFLKHPHHDDDHRHRRDRQSSALASAIHQFAGPGGELQHSAGERWGRTGEGEGGMIGIEFVDGRGTVWADFNCGGMFRTWVDECGRERFAVFREEA
ncbi:MAG: hypothetical protein LQ352_008394 [Teloschistes flavicans]|nr:MAG: hypothetical protein LQ352_008394 [Teloschistes flavicans]